MHTALKSLVIGLGALIALGIVLLLYGLVKKSDDPDWRLFGGARKATTQPALRPGAAMPTPRVSGEIRLNLPEGCAVQGVDAAGGLLYVLTGPAAVCGQVLIVDPAAGKVVGRLTP